MNTCYVIHLVAVCVCVCVCTIRYDTITIAWVFIGKPLSVGKLATVIMGGHHDEVLLSGSPLIVYVYIHIVA